MEKEATTGEDWDWKLKLRVLKKKKKKQNEEEIAAVQKNVSSPQTWVHSKRVTALFKKEWEVRLHLRWNALLITVLKLFFFLHCRTSARHGRSTTGMSLWLRSNFPKKETNNQPNKNNKTSNTHTQAKARARQISQGNLQTKWNQVKQTRPSQPLICSRPPCSTPPRCPIVRCQPYQYLPLDTQASL